MDLHLRKDRQQQGCVNTAELWATFFTGRPQFRATIVSVLRIIYLPFFQAIIEYLNRLIEPSKARPIQANKA